MELQNMDSRPPNPDHTSHISATAAPVNSPDEAELPQNAPRPDANSLGSSLDSLSSDSDSDMEVDRRKLLPKGPVEGWPQLAQLMADIPEVAAFPRFRDLNTKSLLYYQVELNSLRKKLHTLEHVDKIDPRRNYYSLYADVLINEENVSEQLKIIHRVRKVLKEYNEALLQYSKVCALPDPEPFNMRMLRKWLRHEEYGNFNIRDLDDGGPADTWGQLVDNPDDKEKTLWAQLGSILRGLVLGTRPPPNSIAPDLAATEPPRHVDRLVLWVASELLPFFRSLRYRIQGKTKRPKDVETAASKVASSAGQKSEVPEPYQTRKKETLDSWSETVPVKLAKAMSTFLQAVIACLFPVMAISVLSQLQGLRALLLCLAGFSLVFSVGLILLTRDSYKMTEIFAATAA
ncbi:hypothetical protein PMIN02_001913 [Paraphaeosphaeria minitans]